MSAKHSFMCGKHANKAKHSLQIAAQFGLCKEGMQMSANIIKQAAISSENICNLCLAIPYVCDKIGIIKS